MRLAVLLLFTASALGACAQSATPSASASSQDTSTGVVKPPDHPATEEQIREYFSLTGTIRAMREVLSKTVAASRVNAAPYYPASYWDDLQSEFLKVDFEAKLIPIYQQFLSTEDLAEIIRFYRSPAGKRILATQVPISSASQIVFRKMGGEIGVQVYEKHKDEIEAAKQKYEAPAAGK